MKRLALYLIFNYFFLASELSPYSVYFPFNYETAA